MRREPARSALTGGRPVWLLTVTWSGRIYRFSSEAVRITQTTTGSVLAYTGGLNDPEFSTQALDALTVTIEGASIPFEVVFEGVDVGAEWRAGRKLARATAELSMVIVDAQSGTSRQTWEARYALVDGDVVNPQWGMPNRPPGWATFSVEARTFDVQRPLLPAKWRVSPATWSTAPEAYQDKPYPLVIGDAGRYQQSDGTYANSCVTPAFRVDYVIGGGTKVLVSVLATEASINGGTILLLETDTDTTYVAPVTTETDGLLTTVSIADISGAGSAFRRATGPIYACWNNGGGVVNPLDGSRAVMSRGGDLLRYLLGRTGLPIDDGAWEALTGLANRIEFAGFIDDPETDIWEFVRDQLLPWLPVSVVRTPHGLTPIALLPPAPASQLPALTVGPGVALVSPETCTRRIEELVNDQTLQIAQDREGAYLDSQRIGRWTVQDSGAGFSHDVAQVSAAEYGTRPGTALSAPFVWSRSSARRILRQRVRLFGFLTTRIVLQASVEYGWVRLGRWFSLTVASLGITSRRAQCVDRSYLAARAVWELTFEIEDDAQREAVP